MNFTWDKAREDRVLAAVGVAARRRTARWQAARIGLPAGVAVVLLSVAFLRGAHGAGTQASGVDTLPSEGLMAADTALLANADAGSKAD
jgi:hypothetical protein